MLTNFFQNIVTGIIAISMAIAGWFGMYEPKTESKLLTVSASTTETVIDDANEEVSAQGQTQQILQVEQDTTIHKTTESLSTKEAVSPINTLLEEKLAQLRTSNWSDEKRPVPKNLCGKTDGIRFTLQTGDTWSSNDDIDIHVTDSSGGEAGHLVFTQAGEEFRWFTSKSRIWDANQYGAILIVRAREYNDSTVRIRNIDSEDHFFNISVQSAGGQCDFTEYLLLPFPVGSWADIPLTAAGDVGPIAWDFDRDGTYDFYESLIYKPSDEQYKLLFDYRYLSLPEDFKQTCSELIKDQYSVPKEREAQVLLQWCRDKKFD